MLTLGFKTPHGVVQIANSESSTYAVQINEWYLTRRLAADLLNMLTLTILARPVFPTGSSLFHKPVADIMSAIFIFDKY